MAEHRNRYTATEIKAGVMILASLALFFLFLAAIRGVRPPSERAVYCTYFTDIGGLNPGAAVRFGGFKQGRVTALSIDPVHPSRIRVEFEVPPEVPINEQSRAYVGQVSLTAEKHLEITTGEEGAPRLPPGAEIPSQRKDLFGLASEVGGKVGEVLDKVKQILGAGEEEPGEEGQAASMPKLLNNLDGAVSDLRGILQDNRGNIDQLLSRLPDLRTSVEEFVEQMNTLLSENREDVRRTIEKLRATAGAAQTSMEKLDGILADAAKAAERLDGLADALGALLDRAGEAAGDVRDILEQKRPDIEDLIEDLRDAARFAREFAREVMEQPQSIVRGVRPQGRSSP